MDTFFLEEHKPKEDGKKKRMRSIGKDKNQRRWKKKKRIKKKKLRQKV